MSLLRVGVVLFCILCFQVAISQAQITVSGVVIDTSGTSLPSANVLLIDPSDSSLVKGTVSDNSGVFRLKDISPGSYFISVSMVGYQKYFSSPFEVHQESVKRDTVILKKVVGQLGEVSVTAHRLLYEQQIDRMVINVQKSITSAGSTVLEVLRKSPGVQVNRQNGNITLNGKSGVRVMINDRIVRLPTDAVLQMLEGMNSANIKQIELISTPPAKYEAEGDAGLINIKMKEMTDAGHTGTIGINAGYDWAETLGGNFSYSRRRNKLAFFVNYSVNYDRTEHHWVNERNLQKNGFTEIVKSDNRRRPRITVQNARLGMKYDIAKKTTMGFLLTGYERKWKTKDLSNNYSRLGPDSTLITQMSVNETNHWRNSLVNLSLDHSFDDNRSMGVSFDYLYYKNVNPSDYQNELVKGKPSLMDTQGIEVKKETPINIWVGRMDYRHRLAKNITIEAGIKGTLSKFYNDVNVFEESGNEWDVNERYSNKADLVEKIGSAYVSGDWNPAEDLQINGGLRFEYTDTYLSTPSRQGIVDRQNGKIFPSLFIKKKLYRENSIGFSYTRRILRPTFNDLAPFVYFVDPRTFLSGNSNIKPALSDGFKLDYQQRQWTVSLQYSYSDNEIANFQPEVDLNTDKLTYRANNLDYLRSYVMMTAIPLNPAPWWELQANLTGRYQRFKTRHLQENITQNAAGLTANINSTFDLPAGIVLELSGYYQSKSIWGLYQFRPQGAVNAGIQKKSSRR